MWGTDGVRVFTVDDGWGWIFTAIEHWNAECVGWHVCKRGDRFAALQPISMGLARAVCLDLRRCGVGAGLADGSRLPGSSSGASSRPTPSSNSPRPTASPKVQSHAQGTDHPWPHLPQHRGAAERRPRVRRTVQSQWIVEKNGYLSPAQARQAWHTAMSLRRFPPKSCTQTIGVREWVSFFPATTSEWDCSQPLPALPTTCLERLPHPFTSRPRSW